MATVNRTQPALFMIFNWTKWKQADVQECFRWQKRGKHDKMRTIIMRERASLFPSEPSRFKASARCSLNNRMCSMYPMSNNSKIFLACVLNPNWHQFNPVVESNVYSSTEQFWGTWYFYPSPFQREFFFFFFFFFFFLQSCRFFR